jgi:transcriptional regulator with PAS, ATPase and Fis domain
MREIEVFHDVLEHFNIGIAMLSTKGDLIYANNFFRHMTGMDLSNPAVIPFENIVSAVRNADKPGQVSQKHQYSINGSHLILEYRPVTSGTRQLGILAILSQKYTHQSDCRQQESDFYHLVNKPDDKNKILEIFNDFIFEDPGMKQVLDLCVKTAQTSSSVLITGETGVGKEVIADILHSLGPRANSRLVKVNCAAIPDTLIESELFGYEKGAFTGAVREGKTGLIEAANGGTLFLDEITELPLRLQAKLLRFLQSKEYYKLGSTKAQRVDVRVIAASNCDINLMVDQGAFRRDLYYRLCVIPINVPPLRERLADIVPLALHFLGHYCRLNNVEKQFSPAALLALQRYDWPGNVRELQHMVEQLVILSNSTVIEIIDLPERIRKEMQPKTKVKVEVKELIPLKEAYQITERELLREAMRTCKSARQIGQKLGIDHSTVLRKIKSYESFV